MSLPELYGVELPDFLGMSANSMEWPDNDDADERRRSGRVRNVFRSVLGTLPHRDAEAVTERSIELLNQSLRLVSPNDRLLADTASEPALDRVSFVTDEHGERWFLLDAYLSQGDPSADKSWLGLQQPFALDSWLSPRDQAAALLPHLPKLRQSGRWDLVDNHGHIDCCYAGEVG